MKSKSKFIAFVIAVFLIAFAGTSLQAQVKQATPTKSSEWILLKSVDNVTVYYKIGYDSGERVIVMKITNSSTEVKNVTFTLWNDPNEKTVRINAGESLQGQSESASSTQLMKFIPAGQTPETMNPQIKITTTH